MSDDASARRFHRLLDMGDMRLIFHDGRSTKVDSRKLKMASLDGILHNLIEDIVEAQLVGNKRGRDDDSELPSLQLSTMQQLAMHMWEIYYMFSCHICRSMGSMRTGWRL